MDCDLMGQTNSGGGQGHIVNTFNTSVGAFTIQKQQLCKQNSPKNKNLFLETKLSW